VLQDEQDRTSRIGRRASEIKLQDEQNRLQNKENTPQDGYRQE
jgi:hypothetical protein